MSCQTAIMPCNNNNDNSKDSNNSDKSRLSILCIRTQAHPYVHRFHANLYVHIYTHLYTWAIWQINHYYFIKFVIDNVTRMLPAIYVWPCLRSVCLCVCVWVRVSCVSVCVRECPCWIAEGFQAQPKTKHTTEPRTNGLGTTKLFAPESLWQETAT